MKYPYFTQVWPEKSANLFFAISDGLKIYNTHKHFNTCHGINFHPKIFYKCSYNNVIYKTLKQTHNPKNTCLTLGSPKGFAIVLAAVHPGSLIPEAVAELNN